MAAEAPEGWERIQSKAYATHVGPFYRPADGNRLVTGFFADERHGNKRGAVHGGMLATAFDVALGNASWAAADEKPCATVQLNIQYLGGMQLGEFAIIRVEIMRVTRSLIFPRGVMHVGERIIASADGVWKILTWRGEPFKP